MTGLRRRRRAAALLRLGYRVAYRLLQAYAAVARPRTRGVKFVVRDGDERVLFVRHTYGRRDAWEIPGGGMHRGETAEAAVRREAAEELGLRRDDWRRLAVVDGSYHGKREHLEVFEVRWAGEPLRPDPVELADAAWFALDAPPAALGPSTRLTLGVLRADAPA